MKRPVFFILLMLVVLLAAGVLVVSNRMRKPLGPALKLTGVTVAVTAAAPTATQLPATSHESPAATPSPLPLGSATGKNCGGEGKVSLLVLGLALPENAYKRGAGAIRLVRVDFDRPGVTVLALPPDLLVEAPERTTLTQIYWNTRQNIQGADGVRNRQATQALAQALLDNYGYAPDHYVTLDQSAFGQMVDSLGGVVVHVPEAIQEVPEGWHTFEAGEQTLSGDELLDYVRLINRVNQTYNSEQERFERQNLVIQAALSAALEPTNWSKLPGLTIEFGKLLITDLSTNQLKDLACMAREVGGQARLLELPLQKVSTDDQGRVIVDPAIVRSLIDDLTDQ